jgi:uncharacterized protein (DUF1778 family)
MVTRSAHLQIRVTPGEKRTLKQLAQAAGQDLSSYVLSRALPANRLRFEEILCALGEEADHRFALAELNDFLTALAPVELPDAVGHADLTRLSLFLANYVAAMVEQAAYLKDVPPPPWVHRVAPLEAPYFATTLKSLRLHLLGASPVPFKRRNIFVDASLGARA